MNFRFNLLNGCIAVYTIVFLGFLSSCDSLSFRNGIREGQIKYDISYPNIPSDSYVLDLMPKSMTTTFANNEYRTDIIAGMGLFKTSIISNSDSEKLLHTVKVLTTKYASYFSEEELRKINPDFKELEVALNNKTKTIAGYNCKGADITVYGDSTWTFELYYTEEIKIKEVNNHTPFKEIKGVLMEYEITSYDTHMHFVAQEVLDIEVTDEELELEEGYEMVSPEKLKTEIETVFAKVR